MDTLDDVLGEAYDNANAAAAPDSNVKLDGEGIPVQDGKIDTPAPENGVQSDRDAQGRFIKTQDNEGISAVSAATEPPASWGSASKAHWNALPPEFRAEAHAKEREWQDTVSKLKQFDDIAQVLAPRRDFIDRNYGNPAAAIRNLMELSDFSAKDPVGFMRWYAQSRNLDLSSLSGATGGQGGTPVPQQPMRQGDDVSQRLVQLENIFKQNAYNEATGRVKAFESDLNRPHFNNPAVREKMAEYLERGLADTLEQAYDSVVWSLPDVRETLLAERQKAEAEKAQAEAAKRMKAARQAGTVASVTDASAAVATIPAKSEDDLLNEAWERMQSA